jgi:Spy/CpxP family protein refolding chaperone
MKKAIAGIIFLGCMFAFGQSLSYSEGEGAKAKECNYEKHQKKAKGAKADKLKARLDKWTKVLNLTPEQQVKTKAILTKAKEDIKVIWKDTKAKTKEISVAAHDQIAGVLSAEQKAKFQDLRKECEESPQAHTEDKE